MAIRARSGSVVAALWLFAALGPSAHAADKLAPDEKGAALSALLDKMDVENRWLRVSGDQPRALVNWQTGLPKGNTAPQPDCHKTGVRPRPNCTFCSSFVSAVVWRYGRKLLGEKIPFPHPFNQDTERFGEHGQCAPRDFLSNYMLDWLGGSTVRFPKKWKYKAPEMSGWKRVERKGERSVMERAQRLANRGALVLASYKYLGKGKQKPGHIVVVRPAEKTVADVLAEGPTVINAGWKNANAVSLREAFKFHSCGEGKRRVYCGKDASGAPKGAWESLRSDEPHVHFFYYAGASPSARRTRP